MADLDRRLTSLLTRIACAVVHVDTPVEALLERACEHEHMIHADGSHEHQPDDTQVRKPAKQTERNAHIP